MTKLHVFDMDGTLLRGAAAVEISRHLGCFDRVNELEQSYLKGEAIDEPAWWDEILELWAGASETDLDDAFERSPWIGGLPEVFADISERGEHSVVISQSPLFIVQRLKRWGVHSAFATTVERGVPSRQEHLLTEQHKVDITVRLLTEFGLAQSDCVAYGDSMSDVELFRVLERTVAVNAAPLIRGLARRSYDGDDLRGAYQIGRELLERE